MKENHRISIPRELRKLSSVHDIQKVAFMMQDESTFYLLPREKYIEGKLITFSSVDDKGRIFIPRQIYSEKNRYIVYLENETICIKKVIT